MPTIGTGESHRPDSGAASAGGSPGQAARNGERVVRRCGSTFRNRRFDLPLGAVARRPNGVATGRRLGGEGVSAQDRDVLFVVAGRERADARTAARPHAQRAHAKRAASGDGVAALSQ